MTTKTRAEALAKEVGAMRGERQHTYRRPMDEARLVLGAKTVLDTFFNVLGGGVAPLSDRARRFLADVPIHPRMSDVDAFPVLVARGDIEEGTDGRTEA
jgi:hypothetical protein